MLGHWSFHLAWVWAFPPSTAGPRVACAPASASLNPSLVVPRSTPSRGPHSRAPLTLQDGVVENGVALQWGGRTSGALAGRQGAGMWPSWEEFGDLVAQAEAVQAMCPLRRRDVALVRRV